MHDTHRAQQTQRTSHTSKTTHISDRRHATRPRSTASSSNSSKQHQKRPTRITLISRVGKPRCYMKSKLFPSVRHGFKEHVSVAPQRCCLCQQRCLIWKDPERSPDLVCCLGCQQWNNTEACHWRSTRTGQLRKLSLRTALVWRLSHGVERLPIRRYCRVCRRWAVYCVYKFSQLP